MTNSPAETMYNLSLSVFEKTLEPYYDYFNSYIMETIKQQASEGKFVFSVYISSWFNNQYYTNWKLNWYYMFSKYGFKVINTSNETATNQTVEVVWKDIDPELLEMINITFKK